MLLCPPLNPPSSLSPTFQAINNDRSLIVGYNLTLFIYRSKKFEFVFSDRVRKYSTREGRHQKHAPVV